MRGTGWVAAAPETQQKNLRNLLCQLNSLKEVGKLWRQQFEANPNEYKAVVFMRPDVLYRDPFPTHLLPKLKVRTLYVTVSYNVPTALCFWFLGFSAVILSSRKRWLLNFTIQQQDFTIQQQNFTIQVLSHRFAGKRGVCTSMGQLQWDK